VYLFEQLCDPNREVMAHLKAICFLRPTPENLNDLKRELKNPRYGEYYLCTCVPFVIPHSFLIFSLNDCGPQQLHNYI
jgi:hypothetical protein